MTRVSDLESMVQAAWNRGTQVAFGPDPAHSREELRALLGVYSDELQQLDDPRGELIALDLLRTPTTDDERRLAELTADFLGPTLARHPNVNTRYGLVGVAITDLEPQLLAQVLGSRGAPFVSSVSIFGDELTVRRTLSILAGESRPWLGALRIVVPSPPDWASFADPIVPHELVTELVASTPALYAVSIIGEHILRDLAHPSVRRLVVAGHDAIGALQGVGAPLDGIRELDFAFQSSGGRSEPSPRDLARLLAADALPTLRRLDLSRNEPGYREPASLGGTVAVFRFLRSLALVRQLTHLDLPAVRSAQDLDLLQSTLDTMPALERLEVSRVYGHVHHGLRHPTATVVIGTSTPWPARELDDHMLLLELADSVEQVADLRVLVGAMERGYDGLPVEGRLAWDDWWEAIAGQRTTQASFEFPSEVLLTALEACAALLADDAWRAVMRQLRQARDAQTIDTTVRVTPV
ncbi:MAG: hypothetical protein WKG01_07565 [Kofleriaceae bacterium]